MKFFKKDKANFPGSPRRRGRCDSIFTARANDISFRCHECIHGYANGFFWSYDLSNGCIYGRYDDLGRKFPNFHDNNILISMC